jgi:hypothetical protein
MMEVDKKNETVAGSTKNFNNATLSPGAILASKLLLT